MTPIPPDLIARWSPMWAAGHHLERPWWVLSPELARTAAGTFLTWRRCDGAHRYVPSPPFVQWDGTPGDFHIAYVKKAVQITGEALAAHDTAHPLPPPPPMPGQVWAYPDSEPGVGFYCDTTLLAVDVQESAEVAATGEVSATAWNLTFAEMPDFDTLSGRYGKGRTAWPPAGAILVSGPTPWGRDVPWSP